MAEQDPDLFEEFVIEEEEAPSNRPFLLAVGALLGVLLVALLCLGVYQIFFDSGDGTEVATDNGLAATATSISATNEAIETQNAFVTQTIVAMDLTAQAPTATPTLPPTSTPRPEPTDPPTATPVVQSEADEATAAAATSMAAAPEEETPESGGETTGDSGTAGDVSASNANTGGTLPNTGVPVWGGLTAALGLLLIILVARRLRTED